MGNVAATASEVVVAGAGAAGVPIGPEIAVDARQMRARQTAAGQAMQEIGQGADAILVSTVRTSTSRASQGTVWAARTHAGGASNGAVGRA